MADVNANIGVHIDTSQTIAQLKSLRAEISRFNQAVSKSSAAAALAQRDLQTNLVNAINATGKFHARMGLIRTSTESFTHALETNKLSMREYFRYAGGATTTFRKLFSKEFDTIQGVAESRVKQLQTQYIKLGRDASGAMKAISITPTSLNMKDYGTQVAIAAQRQALLNQLLKQGSTNLLNFGKNTQWAGRQLMVGFTIPLAYFGTAAAKTFMDLEAQAIKFKRVYGDMFTTTEQTNKALDDIRALAEEFTKYGVAVSKTMEMAAQAAAMGKVGADLTAQVAEATRLAVLGGVEQEQALETTISLTNAFGIAAEELTSKINFLNAVENQTVVSIEDLTIAIPKAGPVVKQLGGDVEDLAFFLTAMKEGGINASEGANALKSGLASLINPSDKASEMLSKLGININGIVEANKGDVKGTVLDFAAALDTLDPLNRARAIEQLFGKFQFSRLSTLFTNVAKEGTQAARVLDLAGASIEELAILSERELKKVEDAVGTDFRESVEKLKVAIAPIGETFLKTITPFIKSLGNLLDKFNNLEDGTKKFIVVATTLVGVIGPVLLMTFGLLLNAGANIIKLFATMRNGFLKLTGNSTILAEQTNYLTKEQMEAATVAAALDQAHNRLTQRFTSETAALEALRAAFDRATAAQIRFAAANPGMMISGFKGIKGGGTQKFADGTTKVIGGQPGKDSVPSLLTPGEAVIPAPIAQDERFAPLIAALITGDIKKYNVGVASAGDEPGTLRFNGKTYSATSQKTALDLISKINDDLNRASATGGVGREEAGRVITNRMDSLTARGEPLTQSRVFKHIVAGVTTSGGARANNPAIATLRNVINKQYAQAQGRETGMLVQKLRESGLNDNEIRNFVKSTEAHILDPKNKTQKWSSGQVLDDYFGLNNYLNRAGGQSINSALSAVARDPNKFRALGYSEKEIRQLFYDYEFAKTKKHPTSFKELQSIGRIANFEQRLLESPVIDQLDRSIKSDFLKQRHQAIGINALLSVRDPKFYKNLTKRLIQLGPQTASRVLRGQDDRLTREEKRTIAGRVSSRLPFLVGKGETLRTQDSSGRTKDTVVTGQTGTPKPTGMKRIGGAASDNRAVSGSNITNIFPKGFKGPRAVGIGADDGFNAQSMGIKSGGIPKTNQSQERAIKANIDAIDDNTDQTNNTTKQQKTLGQKFNTGANVFSGLTIMGSFMGGKIGEVSQKLAPLAIGLSTITMLFPALKAGLLRFGVFLATPWGIAATAIVATGLLVMKLNKDLEKARKAGVELANAMTMTSKNVEELGKLTGKVGASEIMDRRRQNILAGGLTEPQRQFGQNIMQSEFGKGMLGNIETMTKSGMAPEQVAKNISTQLGQAVMQGVVTPEQAKSIASALGEQLGSYEIPLSVSGKINTLFGPNGERLEKEPLQVALEVKKQSMEQQAKAFETAISQRNKTLGTGGEFAASAALVGAGALAGGPLGAAVGAGVAIKMIMDQNKLKAENLKLDTAAIQLGIESIAQGQDLLDSINVRYDKKVAEAKTDAEIVEIEKQRKSALDEVNKANAASLQTIIDQKDQLSSGAFEAAIKAQADMMYKEGPMAVFKDQALEALKGLKDSDFKAQMQLGFASGDIDPLTLTNILNMAAGNENIEKNITFLINEQGFANTALLSQLISTASQGDQATYEILLSYVNTNDKTFEADMEAIKRIADFKGAYDVTLDMKANGIGKIQAADTALTQIKDLPETITKEALMKANTDGQFNDIIAKWDELSKREKNINKNLIVNYRVGVIDQNIKDAAKAAGLTEAEYLAKGFTPPAATTTTATTTDTKTKDRDTTLDNLLNRLKFIRKASIDAQGGVEELLRITSGKGLQKFNGVMQQMMAGPKGGFNREFISFLEGMDDKVRKTYMTIKNGQVVLTAQGKALKEAFNEKVIGDYQVAQFQATQDTKAQFAALQKLKAAGVDSATALEMVADANLAVAINSKNISSKELNQMAKDAEKAAKAQDRFNLALEASNSAKELKTLEKTAKVLSALQKMPGISKAALDRVAQSPKLMEALYNQIFNGAKKSAQEINTLLDNAAKERTASFKIQMVGDPVGAIQGAIQAALGKAQSVMQAAITARTNQISAPFLNKIAPLQRKIATVKGSPEMLAAQATVREAQGKIKVQQGKVDQLNASMSKIDSQIAGYQEQIQNILANATKQYDDKIDSLNAEIDSMQRKVELDFNKPIEDLQRQIESIEKAVEQQFARRIEDLSEALNDLEREMEVNFARPIEQLQIESGFLSDELSYIDNIADKVNQKYDTQKQELEKIASLNQEIAQSQKQQLDLADAITKGDISAAARAVQEIRAQAAANAAGAQGNILDAARNAELRGIRSLKGRTRKQIEDRQKAIEDQINEIENARYAFEIEKDVLGIKDQIYSLEEKRKDALLAIRPIQDRINELEKNRLPYLIAIEAKERDLLILEGQREAAIAKVQGEVKRIEGEISRLEGDKNKLVGQIKDAEKTLNDLQTAPALVAAEATVDKLNTEIEDLEAQIAAIQAEMDAAIANDNTLNKLIDDLRNMENAMNAAFLKGLEKTTEIKNALVLAGGAAKIAAAAVADLFKAAEGELPVFGSAAKAKDTDAASRMQAYKNSLNALSGESKGGNATSTAIGKIAESLKDAKTPAEAVAKATDAIGKSVGSFTPKIKDSVDYLKSQAESLTTMKDAYDLIVDFVLDISPELVKHSTSIGSAAGSLKPQPGWWESIKTSISNAVTSAGLYANALSAPLTKAQGIASAIASLNQTVVTTHIIETIVKDQQQNATGKMFGGSIKGYMGGGKVKPIYRPMGGLIPYMSNGGFKPMGSDTVPAMLTPGEFVVNRASAEKFGPLLSLINDTKYPSSLARKFKNQDGANIVGSFNSPEYSLLSPNNSSFIQPVYNVSNSAAMSAPYTDNSQSISNNMNTVYNYNVGINVGGTNVDPKNIARAVMSEIKYIDSQRIRGQRA